MLSRILTVGGLTLVSRVTGFARDIVLAAILGAGPLADAFFIALRLPNHFRAIFAEGAFNAAFVPAYARVRGQAGAEAAKLFADRIFTLLFGVELVLLVLALVFTPTVISVLAPGLDPERFTLATALTRITFPYLLLVSMVTLYGGILNTLGRFASPAAAPILLNVAMVLTLGLAWLFPSAGYAAAWGVLLAGFLEALLVGSDAYAQGVLPRFAAARFNDDLKRFFRALGPAVLGSAGTQIALFADTIIASFLPAGALSALYYADRLNQLPIGVIGIAVGTVLLPEMASRLARGDEVGARGAQDRAVELTLLMSLPCFVAFLLVPDLIMLALFGHGEIHRRRRGRRRRDARGLHGRTGAIRAGARALGDIPVARRHRDPGEGARRRCRGQRRLKDRADEAARAGRAGVRDLDRRLDQRCAACCGLRCAPAC